MKTKKQIQEKIEELDSKMKSVVTKIESLSMDFSENSNLSNQLSNLLDQKKLLKWVLIK